MYYKLPEKATKPLVIRGNAFEEIKHFKSNTFDSLIMDLPYLIGFMNLKWDTQDQQDALNYAGFFKECIRVLKHGAYMLIFTGSTNYDLFVNWARLAGFEVKPMVGWIYTSGMPHGIDYVKHLINKNHPEYCIAWKVIGFDVSQEADEFKRMIAKTDLPSEMADKLTDYQYMITVKSQKGDVETLIGFVPKMFKKYIKGKRSLKTSKDLLLSKLRYIHSEYFKYSVISYDIIKTDDGYIYRALLRDRSRNEQVVTGEATEFMRYYDGFNSGLKPALEPIARLQKPMTNLSIVANAMRWGVGGLNIKDCRIPLDGMQDVDIYSIIRSLKVGVGLLPPEKVPEVTIDMDGVIKDVGSMATARKGKDITLGNTTIRDRLGVPRTDLANAINDGSLKDILSQANSNNRRARHNDNLDGNDGVFTQDISDAFNGGGRAFEDPNHGKMLSDLRNQIVGFDNLTAKENTFDGYSESIHAIGNLQSDAVEEAIKFIDGSHEMYGSSGSKVYNYNSGDKSLKKDKNLAIETARQLHRTVNLKKSGTGILEINKEKDPSEVEMRTLKKLNKGAKRLHQKGRQATDANSFSYEGLTVEEQKKLNIDLYDMKTRHNPVKHKGAFWGGGDMPMDNKTFTWLTFFDKMLGRYPSNVIATESGALNRAVIPPNKKGFDYDKIFMVPKPGTKEKTDNIPKKYHDELHKTVKPLKLMEHLVKLVNPRGVKNPLVGDFFMGSGTTGVAAKGLSIRFVGVELDTTYYEIAKHRIRGVKAQRRLNLI